VRGERRGMAGTPPHSASYFRMAEVIEVGQNRAIHLYPVQWNMTAHERYALNR